MSVLFTISTQIVYGGIKMAKIKPTIHEKTVKRVKQQTDAHLSKFTKMENDIREAVSDLEDVVVSIDAEMDKLAALRIDVQKQISSHEESLKHIVGFLGGIR
jgi:peptidoglycan hydrolase CwlO-like protein